MRPEIESHLSQAIKLEEQAEHDLAIAQYEHILQLAPDFGRAHFNLGLLLLNAGRFAEAAGAFSRAIQTKPDSAGAYFNRGNAYMGLGQPDLATQDFKQATTLNPEFTEAYIALGYRLYESGQLSEAATAFEHAVASRPDCAEALGNLGMVLDDMHRFSDAIRCFKRTLELEPDHFGTMNNLGNALKATGQIDRALEQYRQALRIAPAAPTPRSNLIFSRTLLAETSPADLLDEARLFGEIMQQEVTPFSCWLPAASNIDPLRIGFVSGDFFDHPVGGFLEGTLQGLANCAPQAPEVFLYATQRIEDDVTRRLQMHCTSFKVVDALSDQDLAQLIHADKIKILIDLSGHTAHNRLPMFAWRPAPVQATWLGYLGTTGLSTMDYLIADHHTLPPQCEAYFSEKIWRLPESYIAFTPPAHPPQVNQLPAERLGFVTFGSFNNMSKINPQVIRTWSKILLAVPNCKLFLKNKQFADPAIQNDMISAFAAQGVASDRLQFSAPVARAIYLTSYNDVDIGLDPFPYPGITTTVESLFMGVPVLTLGGNSFLSRQGVGLMRNVGLPEWIADSEDDYVQRAVALSSDLSRLSAIRAGLREHALQSPIFDSARFAKHLNEALCAMWQQWCDQHEHH